MIRIFPIPVLLCLCCFQLGAHGNRFSDNGHMLKQLDETLSKKSVYDQYLLDRVDVLRSIASEQKDSSQIYNINKRIASEFSSYSLDSTLYYLERNLEAARSAGDRNRILESNIMIAEEYTAAGYHLEASDLLRSIDGESVPEPLMLPYTEAMYNLLGELRSYYSGGEMFEQQSAMLGHYRDLLLKHTQYGTYSWYKLKREEALQSGKSRTALEYSAKLLELSEEGTKDYAIACYLYQELLSGEEHKQERIRYLILSAMSDIMCATKDYASLNFLSQELLSEGDIDRAFEYSTYHCMPDAIFFGGKLRPWQISQFFPEIGAAYQTKNDRWQKTMNTMVTVMACLFILLVLLMVFIFMRQQVIVKTREALQKSYLEIERRNSDLLEANNKLSELNSKILESDKVKQEYIALFLGILSENINTVRQYKNHVLKYLRRGNAKEIEAEIEALPPIDEDILEFYKMFDRTFLNLYPDFVEKFNSLLSDGNAIVPKGDDNLSPELRVFALIKLGITDSGKIASLLHYSVNTIYNYRAKIKNRSRGERADFEDAVRRL